MENGIGSFERGNMPTEKFKGSHTNTHERLYLKTIDILLIYIYIFKDAHEPVDVSAFKMQMSAFGY